MMDGLQPQKRPSDGKLWIDVVPPPSVISEDGGRPKGSLAGKSSLVKPTVTTLLRHHSTLVRQEKEERSKLQSYTDGSFTPNEDREGWRARELEELKERQISGAKRILKAKLAYHKAIAATEQKANEKLVLAQHKRDETRRLAVIAETEKLAMLARRRAMAAEIQDVHAHSKDMVVQIQNQKRRQAVAVREQTNQLKADAKHREFVEFASRKERIQQIQASRQALRAANATGASTSGFIGALGSPDTEIRLKLTKEAEEAALEERRRRVQNMKRERDHKLQSVKAKLEKQAGRVGHTRSLQVPFKTLPPFTHPSGDLADDEIVALMQELHTYQQHAPPPPHARTKPQKRSGRINKKNSAIFTMLMR